MAAPIPANGNLVGTIETPYVTRTLTGTSSVADYVVQNNVNNYANFFDLVQRGSSLVYTIVSPFASGTGVYTLPMLGTANSIEFISRDSGSGASTGIFRIVAPGDYRSNTTDFGIQNYGTNGNDVVYGLLGANQVNILTGGAGNDTLVGGAGTNILTGGSGSNTIIGGTGSNRYRIDVADGGTQTIQASGADNIIQVLLPTTSWDWNFERVGNDAVGYITNVDGNRTDLILKDHFTTSRVDSLQIYVNGFSTSGSTFSGMGFLDPGVGVFTGTGQGFIGDAGSNTFNLTGTTRSAARVFGNDGADTLIAGPTSTRTFFYAGDGIDTFVASGALANYTLSVGTAPNAASGRQLSYANLGLKNSANPDYLQNVERLKFTDRSIALDVKEGENAGMVFRMYKAGLGREPDWPGLGAWLSVMDKGFDKYTVLAAGFTGSTEFKTTYGTLSNSEFVNLMYKNVLGRSGGTQAQDWIDAIEIRGATREQVLFGFSESPENVKYSAALIGQGMTYIEPVG